VQAIELNWVAVIASAFIVYVLGAIWYSPVLFARQWMQLIGRTDEQTSGGGAPVALIVQAVVTVIAAATTAVVVAWSHASGPIEGAGVGLLLSLGLIASDHLKLVAFEHRALPLFAINNAYTVIALVIIGAITATW
jgi:hypothetical protein